MAEHAEVPEHVRDNYRERADAGESYAVMAREARKSGTRGGESLADWLDEQGGTRKSRTADKTPRERAVKE